MRLLFFFSFSVFYEIIYMPYFGEAIIGWFIEGGRTSDGGGNVSSLGGRGLAGAPDKGVDLYLFVLTKREKKTTSFLPIAKSLRARPYKKRNTLSVDPYTLSLPLWLVWSFTSPAAPCGCNQTRLPTPYSDFFFRSRGWPSRHDICQIFCWDNVFIIELLRNSKNGRNFEVKQFPGW